MKKNLIVHLLAEKKYGTEVEVSGWVRTRRDSGSLSFIEISDGSCLSNLQVVAEENLSNYHSEVRKLSTGCAVMISGELTKSPAKGQDVELKAGSITVLGEADPQQYPLQKKRHGFEFLRSISHLRPRTNALAAVARIRSELNFAVHRFFKEQSFFQVHTPLITTSDCEGAGEMFTVTALTPEQISSSDSYEKDFFGRKAGLTVSGQLQAEVYAMSMGRVYTFGPTFRAENSNTSRHLAEFWMVEPEMAFCDLACNMSLAEEMVKELVTVVLQNCSAELDLFNRFVCKGLRDRLVMTVEKPFVHLTYDEAVKELTQAKRSFDFPVSWGIDLQAEHERYLCEEVVQGVLVVTDYPKEIKPFYMRQNDDEKTVAAMDILTPGIGELIGGSQREERYDRLLAAMLEAGLDPKENEWYLDLRRYGSVPHSGYGLGFERFIQYVTGMANIRDVIPFPRTPGSAPC